MISIPGQVDRGARRLELLDEKARVGEQIAKLRQQVADARRRVALRGVYVDPFRQLERELAEKGQEGQRIQRELSALKVEARTAHEQVYGAMAAGQGKLAKRLRAYINDLRFNDPDCDDIADELEALLNESGAAP